MEDNSAARAGMVVDPGGLLTNPLWAALLPERAPEDSVIAWRLSPASFLDDVSKLAACVSAAPRGTVVVVVADRRCLRLLATSYRRPNVWMRAPTIAELTTVIQRLRVETDLRTLVWPNSSSAKLLLDPEATRAWRWAHRNGVLGGGGRKFLIRWFFQSVLMTRVVRMLASGAVVTGRKY